MNERLKRKLISGFEKYNESLNDKVFLIVYEDGLKYSSIELVFRKHNFLHLTGINYTGRANQFYKELASKKLNFKNISVKNGGTTELKLDVLGNLKELLSSHSNIGDYNGGLLNLKTDKVLGKSSGLISLGLLKNNNNYLPQSLLKEESNKITNKRNRVVLVMRKTLESEKFNNLLYKNRTFDVTNLKPKDTERIQNLNILL